MQLIQTEHNVRWLPGENIVETFVADKLPAPADCASAFAIVFKDGALLQTDLSADERSVRGYDIPGGHRDLGETPAETAARECFEETGVRVRVIKLAGYQKNTLTGPKPENYRYPYPTSYMAFYLCEAVEETPFVETAESHGRAWLRPEHFAESSWCRKNLTFLQTILSEQTVA